MSNETLDPKVFADEAIQDAMATVIAGNFAVEDIAKACHEAIASRQAAAIIPTRKNAKPWADDKAGARARN